MLGAFEKWELQVFRAVLHPLVMYPLPSIPETSLMNSRVAYAQLKMDVTAGPGTTDSAPVLSMRNMREGRYQMFQGYVSGRVSVPGNSSSWFTVDPFEKFDPVRVYATPEGQAQRSPTDYDTMAPGGQNTMTPLSWSGDPYCLMNNDANAASWASPLTGGEYPAPVALGPPVIPAFHKVDTENYVWVSGCTLEVAAITRTSFQQCAMRVRTEESQVERFFPELESTLTGEYGELAQFHEAHYGMARYMGTKWYRARNTRATGHLTGAPAAPTLADQAHQAVRDAVYAGFPLIHVQTTSTGADVAAPFTFAIRVEVTIGISPRGIQAASLPMVTVPWCLPEWVEACAMTGASALQPAEVMDRIIGQSVQLAVTRNPQHTAVAKAVAKQAAQSGSHSVFKTLIKDAVRGIGSVITGGPIKQIAGRALSSIASNGAERLLGSIARGFLSEAPLLLGV